MPVNLTDPILRTLLVGLAATLISALPAAGAGWLLARRAFPGRSALGLLVMVPLVLPPVVVGALMLEVFGRQAPAGAWLADHGWPVPFTLTGAVLAAAIVGFPLFVASSRSAFEAVDPRYEALSQSLGHPPARTFWRVTLPLALPGIAAGAVLAFARALGEFGATAIIAGNIEGRTRTISLAIYSLMERPGEDSAVRWLMLASLALASSALGVWEALNRWQRQRLEVEEAPRGAQS